MPLPRALDPRRAVGHEGAAGGARAARADSVRAGDGRYAALEASSRREPPLRGAPRAGETTSTR